MSETFTGLLRTLKSNSSAKESMLLTSCEAELNELMRQIDIMVENKRMEWEHQVQAIQLQYERKDREAIKLRETVELRNQEIGQLQQCLECQEESRKNLIGQYEEQLSKLQSEMDNVKKNYGKLQRNANRQISDAENYKEQMNAEMDRKTRMIHKGKLHEEELEDKVRALESENEVNIQKIKGMEDQRRSLMEKSELMQEQLLGYQGQLTRKKQMLDNLEQQNITKIAELENEILNYKDSLQTSEETIKSLKDSLEEARFGGEKSRKDRTEIEEEINQLKQNKKQLDKCIEKLRDENTSNLNIIKNKEDEIENLKIRIMSLEKQMKRKDEEMRDADNLRAKSNNEDELIRKLQRSINKYQHEVEVKSVQLEVSSQKIKQQEKRLQMLDNECKELREDILNKHLHSFDDSKLPPSVSDSSSKTLLNQENEKHKAEISGMKEQMVSLTENLHQRERALADMSERATVMEQDLRDVTTKCDKRTAELQVTNAQLEALRLENRHLREATMDEQISSTADMQMFETHLMEIKNANATVIAQLEDENEHLRNELQHLTDDNIEHSRQIKTQPNQRTHDDDDDDDDERITRLQEQLDVTIRNYEEKIQELREENQELKNDPSKVLEESHDGSSSSTHKNQRSPQNGQNELDFSNLFDLLENTSTKSGTDSRRPSIGTDFMLAEEQREKDLQKLLQSRIAELERKTNQTLDKYLH